MKKIILLTALFLLIGVGCNKTQSQNTTTENEQAAQAANQLEQNTQADTQTPAETKFTVHYPSFIPEGLTLSKEETSIFDEGGADETANYRLESTGDNYEKTIFIMERKKGLTEEEKNSVQDKTEIPGLLDGFSLVTTFDSVDTNHVVFSTEDGHMVQVSSGYFDVDTLTKVAKSIDQ